MYSRFTIQTRLSVAEAKSALERLVDVKEDESTIRPFVGQVENGRFKFRRIVIGRNSFLPIVTGRIDQGEGGAVLRGVMRFHLFVAAFMTSWIGMAVIGTVEEMSRALHEHHAPAVAVVFFPLFGIAITVAGYSPERRKAMRLLNETFQRR